MSPKPILNPCGGENEPPCPAEPADKKQVLSLFNDVAELLDQALNRTQRVLDWDGRHENRKAILDEIAETRTELAMFSEKLKLAAEE